MKEKYFCPECLEIQPISIVEKEETYNVLGIDKITIKANVCTCDVCKTEIFHDELDDDNLKRAYQIFNSRHPDKQINI